MTRGIAKQNLPGAAAEKIGCRCTPAANEVPRSHDPRRAAPPRSSRSRRVSPPREPLDFTPVKRWIARQDDFRAVTADFTQTRSLRALRSPLASPGRLWFKAPNSFRWELGKPAKTIVLRKGDCDLRHPAGQKARRALARRMRSSKSSASAGDRHDELPVRARLRGFSAAVRDALDRRRKAPAAISKCCRATRRRGNFSPR